MKRIVVVLAGVALLEIALAAFAIPALAQGPNLNPPAPFTNPWGNGWGPGGMMRGWLGGYGPTQSYTPTVPNGYRGWGPGGMMGGFGCGGMALAPHSGAGVGGYGFGYGNAPNAQSITLDQAVSNAQQYVASYNNADLKLVEVEEYTYNFYGLVQEKSTGKGAFQILVNKYSGAVSPEMGPNMMWNTKYSPMGWMTLGPQASAGVGGWFSQPTGAMTITPDQAHANAAEYLKTNLPNTTVEDQGDTFYGYYNFDVLQNGKTYGMLSVNGYTGAVWYHTWHGDYIATKELN
ncbi:MAG: hypothetical protein M1132_09025 [Chloroflexi bacterium]|nr:hypothetical protein [Chloroflexota bacterium]